MKIDSRLFDQYLFRREVINEEKTDLNENDLESVALVKPMIYIGLKLMENPGDDGSCVKIHLCILTLRVPLRSICALSRSQNIFL
jgi:hypothetical protein